MSNAEAVSVYSSQSSSYHQAFKVFLEHTDQKAQARAWLNRLVEQLPERRTFIDAGAGNGKVTEWFVDKFQRTIAMEPSPSLGAELCQRCPGAELLPQTILEAQPPARGDMVLCSHVFYYIPQESWLANLERMASWLAPQGRLIVILQSHGTDCMQLLEHFSGQRFNLATLAESFQRAHGQRYQVTVESVPAQVATADFAAAYTVAEFMLNLLPMARPPARSALRGYVRERFALPAGGYRFSCDQTFLQIQPRQATAG
jgi:hypothetical protein